MQKKNICYLIFATGAAKGGHYRSLVTTAEAMMGGNNCFIINLGYTHSPVITNSTVPNHFIPYNGFNYIETVRKIIKVVDIERIGCLHAFDYTSFFIARILANKYGLSAIFTKCGGRPPTWYYPRANVLTLFSEEDIHHFKQKSKYRKTSFHLIPNRVASFKCNQGKVRQLNKKYGLQNRLVFLRICRISKYYKKSIYQSIQLIDKLSSEFPQISLLVVGTIQDQVVFRELKNISGKNVHFETEPEYTLNAKEIIDTAQVVIGTGRGFMEAASQGKVLMTPAKENNIPVLINQDNFDDAFKKNFSERIEFAPHTLAKNFQEVKKLMSSKKAMEDAGNLSKIWFHKYFSIDSAMAKYDGIYDSSTFKKESRIDLAKHWIFIVKNNLGTWYRNSKSKYVTK